MANSTDTTQVNGVQDTDTAHVKFHATKDEALAHKPASDAKGLKPFEISKNGAVVGWIWAGGYDNALARTARNDGFSVSLGGKTAPVTKEVVAAKLAEFSDDELAAMGLTRKPQKGGRSK